MKIMQIFKGLDGKYSATRFVYIIGSLSIIFTWCFLSIKAGEPKPITIETTALIGVIQAGKVFDKKNELPSPPKEANNEPTPVE